MIRSIVGIKEASNEI
jgi:hypothetical protein